MDWSEEEGADQCRGRGGDSRQEIVRHGSRGIPADFEGGRAEVDGQTAQGVWRVDGAQETVHPESGPHFGKHFSIFNFSLIFK